MRPLLLLCLLVLGCTRSASTDTSTRPDATVPAPVEEPLPPAQAAPVEPPEAPTAAARAAGCTTDADCGLTLIAEGECCPMLCTPRGVTARQAQELERKAMECEQRQPCPVPMCAPPRRQPVPVCEAGQCAVRHVDLETR